MLLHLLLHLSLETLAEKHAAQPQQHAVHGSGYLVEPRVLEHTAQPKNRLHSDLNALSGSTLAARRAGIQVASDATPMTASAVSAASTGVGAWGAPCQVENARSASRLGGTPIPSPSRLSRNPR